VDLDSIVTLPLISTHYKKVEW